LEETTENGNDDEPAESNDSGPCKDSLKPSHRAPPSGASSSRQGFSADAATEIIEECVSMLAHGAAKSARPWGLCIAGHILGIVA